MKEEANELDENKNEAHAEAQWKYREIDTVKNGGGKQEEFSRVQVAGAEK